ncbi:MAG: hypothetical protein LC768_13445 [Acidobacteria bacterium]|nr:hypothetical protein [Acidobacteriota bacterium]MCA1639316.1 hypothetical protein [Acidobacteriota bacterium]
MSGIVIDLIEPNKNETLTVKQPDAPEFGDYQKPKKRSVFLKILGVLGILFAVVLLTGAIGGYFYWQNLKTTPQYSLALLVDAAKRDDQQTIDEFVDTDAVVDDFMPQITGKAVELYGRGLPPSTIQKVAQVAIPFLPAVKQRARAEIPNLIRERTEKFANIPFWVIAVGAEGYLDITQESDKAFVKSKLQDRPLEIVLMRNGNRWQIVGVKDEELAKRIAEKIGQELITVAKKGGIKKAGEQLGVFNLEDILKNAEGIFK